MPHRSTMSASAFTVGPYCGKVGNAIRCHLDRAAFYEPEFAGRTTASRKPVNERLEGSGTINQRDGRLKKAQGDGALCDRRWWP